MLNSLDLPGAPADTRVVVAMSGGVDSTLVAALLRQEGYDVVGVTLRLYDDAAATRPAGTRRAGACCAGADIGDARRAAERIGIPHYVLDYESRFREAVVERFADGYARGETPIPCVECNRTVKFRDLMDTARDLGAAALATGHYVASRPAEGGGRALLRAAEAARDQSYFLYATTPEQLAFLRFPLGEMTKAETRARARALGLANADKPDSQDICFVPDGRYADVVARLRPDAARPGEIVDGTGRVLGRHPGIMHYTVGQRRGLGIAAAEPLYVVRLDAASARVVVGPRAALATASLMLRDVNWLAPEPLGPEPRPVHVRVRSTRPPVPAEIVRGRDGVVVTFPAGQDGVSPGQACVVYADGSDRARVLGGGTIAKAHGAASGQGAGTTPAAHAA